MSQTADDWSLWKVPRALAIAIVVLALIRLYVAQAAGLSDDEAYYRLWAAGSWPLSFYDHPPAVAWFIGLGRTLAGDTALGVRLIGVVASAAGAVALWRTVAILFDGRAAERSVWVFLAMPLLGVGAIVMTPDTPSVLFAGLTLWTLAELHRSGNANWWLAAGIFAGLGLVSKYTNLFIGVSILVWLVWVPNNRRWFLHWQLWAGGALAVLVAVPVVYWNATHEWASFAKQFGRVGSGSGADIKYLAELIGGFLALASPLIAGLAVVGLLRLAGQSIRTRGSAETLVAAFVLPMLCYFLIHAVHGRVQANWLAPLYPQLAICAALAIGTIADAARRRVVLAASVGLGLAMTGVIYAHAVQPVLAGLIRKDPTDQLRGWPEFSDEIERLRAAHGAKWLATANYSMAGQLAFSLRGRARVAQINELIRYEHLPCLDENLANTPALFVELERRRPEVAMQKVFGIIAPLGRIARVDSERELGRYSVFLVSGYKGSAGGKGCLRAAP